MRFPSLVARFLAVFGFVYYETGDNPYLVNGYIFWVIWSSHNFHTCLWLLQISTSFNLKTAASRLLLSSSMAHAEIHGKPGNERGNRRRALVLGFGRRVSTWPWFLRVISPNSVFAAVMVVILVITWTRTYVLWAD